MTSDVEKTLGLASNWDQLTEEQKVENLLSRIKSFWLSTGMSAGELEMVLDVAGNAFAVLKAHGVVRTQPLSGPGNC